MKFDRQDILLLAGTAAILGGIGAWSIPAASVLFGLMCLAAVFLIERTKPLEKGAGANGSPRK